MSLLRLPWVAGEPMSTAERPRSVSQPLEPGLLLCWRGDGEQGLRSGVEGKSSRGIVG